jgi:hypothetical protein
MHDYSLESPNKSNTQAESPYYPRTDDERSNSQEPWPFEPIYISHDTTVDPLPSQQSQLTPTSTTPTAVYMNHAGALIGILLGLTCLLSAVFLYLVIPLLREYIRSRRPVDPERIRRRYETIEGWLITKVRVYHACVVRTTTCNLISPMHVADTESTTS